MNFVRLIEKNLRESIDKHVQTKLSDYKHLDDYMKPFDMAIQRVMEDAAKQIANDFFESIKCQLDKEIGAFIDFKKLRDEKRQDLKDLMGMDNYEKDKKPGFSGWKFDGKKNE